MKKILSILICLALLFGTLTVSVISANAETLYDYEYPKNNVLETQLPQNYDVVLKGCDITSFVENVYTRKIIFYNNKTLYSTSTSDYIHFDTFSLDDVINKIINETLDSRKYESMYYRIQDVYCVHGKTIAKLNISRDYENGYCTEDYVFLLFNEDLSYSILTIPKGTYDNKIFYFNNKYMLFSTKELYESNDLKSWQVQNLSFNLSDNDYINYHCDSEQYIYISVYSSSFPKLYTIDKNYSIKEINIFDSYYHDDYTIYIGTTTEYTDENYNLYDKIVITVSAGDRGGYSWFESYSFDEKNYSLNKGFNTKFSGWRGWVSGLNYRPITFYENIQDCTIIFDRNNEVVNTLSSELNLQAGIKSIIYGVEDYPDEVMFNLYYEGNDEYYEGDEKNCLLMSNDYYNTIYKAKIDKSLGNIRKFCVNGNKFVLLGDNITIFDYSEVISDLNTLYITDDKTRISLKSVGNELPLDSELIINESSYDDNYYTYDISVKENSKKYFDKDIFIKIPLKYDANEFTTYVYQKDSNGNWTSVDFTAHTTNAVFVQTNNLNSIKIVGKAKDDYVPTQPTTPTVTQPTQANNTIKPIVKFTVSKLSVKAPKLTSGKKLFKVKYTKVKNAVGFQVRYKTGKGKWKVKTFNTAKSATKVIKGLKKGKYKVQIRTFTKGKKVYSNWTKAKTVKVK